MRPALDAGVLRWLASQDAGGLHTTAVAEAELRAGVAGKSQGRRRDRIAAAVDAVFATDLAGRVLSFDGAAARAFAEVQTARQAAGRSIATADAMVAAIALSRGATVATRYTAGLEGAGVAVVDSWRGLEGRARAEDRAAGPTRGVFGPWPVDGTAIDGADPEASQTHALPPRRRPPS